MKKPETTMTRQYLWQQKKHELGLCITCGKPVSLRNKWRCEKHRLAKNEENLRWYYRRKYV